MWIAFFLLILFGLGFPINKIVLIIGWAAWAFSVYLAISSASKCRKMINNRHLFQWTIAVQSLFWWTIVVIFLLFPLNKIHILWLLPILHYCSKFIALSDVPFITPAILSLSHKFMKYSVVGHGSMNWYEIYATNSDTQETSIAWERIFDNLKKYEKLPEMQGGFERVIGRYLIPDYIDPTKFYANWIFIMHSISERSSNSNVAINIKATPSLLVFLPHLAERLKLGYPYWFIAAYPDVANWVWGDEASNNMDVVIASRMLKKSSVDESQVTEIQIYNRMMGYDSSGELLRILIDSYHKDTGNTLECTNWSLNENYIEVHRPRL
jgi:hypothetical protein